ncbi:MAG: Rieske 2Fe-2S domain-containing protein [Trueperaceae bacterium]|nr:Rieske 2Fe-2S domain-containing protein [Trueperaceae bacterium]
MSPATPETRHAVGSVDDFPEEGITPVTVEGREVVVVRHEGRFYALPDRCTHQKYPLHDGEVLPGKIKCIHHGATFDLNTGKPTMPAVKKIELFDAEVEDGTVYVRVQSR